MQNIALGQYFPGTSVVHRLDPRIKLSMTIALIALIFFVRKFLFVPAFGATMPGGRKAPDIEKMEKQDTAGESEE